MKRIVTKILLISFLIILILATISTFSWLLRGEFCPLSINRMPTIYSNPTVMVIGGIRQNLQDWYIQSFCQGKTEILW